MSSGCLRSREKLHTRAEVYELIRSASWKNRPHDVGDSSWTRPGEQRNLIGQMDLIEITELCRHSGGAA
jgi:hypothetical protein